MLDGESLPQALCSSGARVRGRYDVGSEQGGNTTADQCYANSASGALTDHTMAESVIYTEEADQDGQKGASAQDSAQRGSKDVRACAVNSIPPFQASPQSLQMLVSRKITPVWHTPTSGQALKTHGDPGPLRGDLLMMRGAAAVECSAGPHCRNKPGVKEKCAHLIPGLLESVLFATSVASPESLRGTNLYSRTCACWRGRCVRLWLRMGATAESGGRWLRRCLSQTVPEARAGQRQRCKFGPCALLVARAACVALVVLCICTCAMRLVRRPHVPGWNGTRSILVQHEDAPRRMQLKYSRKVKWIHLPSWTLRVVPATCEDCLDSDTYAIALQRAVNGLGKIQCECNTGQQAELQALPQEQRQRGERSGAWGVGGGAATEARARDGAAAPLPTWALEDLLKAKGGVFAVFANIGAPLGKIGPMLLAMRSVTDDVDVAAELPHWHWLQYANISSATRPARPPPYVAVMGIHSTDTVSRAALRDGQRRTWFQYTAVARRENKFHGRLLPLYLLAAEERAAAPDPTWVGQDEDTGPEATASFHRPTVQEFADATNFYRALAAPPSSAGAAPVNLSYRQRRMTLRPKWRTSDLTSSPCDHMISVTVRSTADHPRPPLAAVAEYLRLPIIPAFTAAARFLCEASSGLWAEALQHRDILWLEMLSDRNGTARREVNDSRWAMAAPVIMSQKTVLWLEYAYHAFPDVAFIGKSYDDVYIKVPQMLSDFTYVLSGRQSRDLDANLMSNAGNAPPFTDTVTAAADTVRIGGPLAAAAAQRLPRSPESECVDWGLQSGPLFSRRHHWITRKVARIVLEEPQDAYGTNGLRDVALLSMYDFNPIFAGIYRDIAMDDEDLLLAGVLRDRRARAAQLCPNERITHAEETMSRFHELRRDVSSVVTWASVVLHRCTRADMYHLHSHYFVEEHQLRGGTTPAEAAAAEAAAQERGAKWIRANINASLGPGWDNLNPVRWVPDGARAGDAKPKILAVQDGVAVYNVTF
ncbi:phosphoglycan beta 1,3 galactosyltransferase-like protein [Leishmania tarentolae]|uniref:Phosphoglycan beta 1,3 galactosyltransferase-like protein n=1 Tax=Leishmania tarentolae TaxID=5689 RepID=A0A640K8K9_LEITA|nr:phosphoglycan beta 1,3 galactosyltransferase-like protein [Leishmania tarentolae]